MTHKTLLRLSAAAAITGGALRIGNSFTAATFDAHTLALLYFITDVMLLFGTVGIYLSQSKALGLPGLLGFVISVIGVLTIRSSALFGAGGYFIGATVLLVGLTVLGVAMLIHATFPRRVPLCWIASLALGIVGLSPGAATWAIPLAGVSFGAGFVLAGAHLLSASVRPGPPQDQDHMN